MIYTIDPKIINDIICSNPTNLKLVSELSNIKSHLEELEVVDAKILFEKWYKGAIVPFSQYLTENNYIIVKNPNK